MNSFRKAILSGKGPNSGDPLQHDKLARGAEPDDLSSVEVPRSEARSENHRDDDRHRLDQETATVRFDGEEYEVDLINLSGGGAMIRADFAPRLWERIDLIFGEGAEIECAVRWLRYDRVGLEFAHETRIDCDPETRDALLLDVIRRSFADMTISIARPDVEPVRATPAAKERDNDAIANSRRTERRHPLVWKGQVLYNHGSEKVRLRNISANGALIEAPISYPLGAEIYLDLDDAGQHFATVSWTRGDKVGLKFQNPFDLRLLGKSKPEVAPAMMIRPGPSRIYADQDNPWAEGWQRQSLDELREDLEGYLKR
ncbi:PilZ domain-containing protein [Sphingomonas sp. G124]|uniref:PilZ domain-containing protein n=1 Tax=Sphingomonas cremea TaxID=2904799 RepID=A0A9X1QJ50_9SPHN|nr:PilZ domain-containing protein [Sphingomonas cremea]MCF2514456.1 PilZ domain-containing protein [Sphingomonas cremea]